jgi:uncharacterized protein
MGTLFKRILLIFFVTIIVLFVVGIEFILPQMAVTPYRRTTTATPKTVGLAYEDFTVKNGDIDLKGYWIPNDAARATVICLHGIHSCKERNLDIASSLHSTGCNVILLDLRAHGKSTGKYCTFGQNEKYDLQKVIDFALEKGKINNIGIHGSSLGGAIALQTLAIDNRLKFGIIESTFTNYSDVTYEYSDDYVGFKNRFLTNYVASKSAKIAGFDPQNINPEACCRQITVPIFMEHGTADERIPYAFGQRNFSALASTSKVFYTIPGGRHSRVFAQGGEPYWQAMKTFLEQQMEKL